MSRPLPGAEHRARRLLHAYPKSWRARYGDEFAELLMADIEERPRSWRRVLDVMWSGALTRMAPSGLCGQALDPIDQTRTSAVTLGVALAVFLSFGLAMWSQLTVGWQWSRPDTMATTAAMVVMSAMVLVFCGLGVLAAVPIAGSVLVRFWRRQAAGLVWPAVLFVGGTTVLVLGGRHFGNGWPGTGGHHWGAQGLVPGGMAAFTWASTLSVSSYWVHPGALSSFPVTELVWMAVSPVAIVCLVAGAATTVRRVPLSPKVLVYESRLGSVASFAMLGFLTACSFWIVDGGPGPRDLFHAGSINVAEIGMMVLALGVARLAIHRSVAGGAGIRVG